MLRKTLVILSVLVLSLIVAVPTFAAPGKPNFGPALYADGEVWGTKGTTALPAPKNNVQSFDKLFVITNGLDGQLPVGEAAPGNRMYNGGRWFTHTVEWTVPAHALLTSYEDVMFHYNLGHLTITPGSPGGPGAPPDYFQCPLLPVK